MTRSEFSIPRLGTVRRSTLLLAVAFLAVLTLYLLVRPVPELAPAGRTAEPKKKAQITQPDSRPADAEPAPKRAASPSATPRPATPTPVPTPTPTRTVAVLPEPGASKRATADSLFPLLAPPATGDPGPANSPAPGRP